jgi:hypothetical protein
MYKILLKSVQRSLDKSAILRKLRAKVSTGLSAVTPSLWTKWTKCGYFEPPRAALPEAFSKKWSKVSTICPTNLGQKVSNPPQNITVTPFPLSYMYTCTHVHVYKILPKKCPAFVGQKCSKKERSVRSRHKALSVHSISLDKMDKMWIL